MFNDYVLMIIKLLLLTVSSKWVDVF